MLHRRARLLYLFDLRLGLHDPLNPERQAVIRDIRHKSEFAATHQSRVLNHGIEFVSRESGVIVSNEKIPISFSQPCDQILDFRMRIQPLIIFGFSESTEPGVILQVDGVQ